LTVRVLTVAIWSKALCTNNHATNDELVCGCCAKNMKSFLRIKLQAEGFVVILTCTSHNVQHH